MAKIKIKDIEPSENASQVLQTDDSGIPKWGAVPLVSNLQSFADNAAAITGGLSVGEFYHTAGTVKVVI